MPGSNLLAVVYILPCIRCCWWIDQSMLLRRKCILNQTSLELVQAANANDVCKHVWHLGTPNHHRHLEVRANGVKLQATKQANCTADVWWAEVPHLPWGWSISWKWKWKLDNEVEYRELQLKRRWGKVVQRWLVCRDQNRFKVIFGNRGLINILQQNIWRVEILIQITEAQRP